MRRLLVVFAALCGCSAAQRDANPPKPAQPDPAVSAVPPAVDTVRAAQETQPAPDTPPKLGPEPIVLVTDAEDLDPLREQFSVGRLLFAIDASTTKALRASASYRDLAGDLIDSSAHVPKWWLGHPRTEFELIAIVNRLDRMDMAPGTCGETRLIYRLVHRSKKDARRRLPLALNLVFAQDDDGASCAEVAKSWMKGAVSGLTDDDGPLSSEGLALSKLLSVESNTRKEDSNVLRVHWQNKPERRARFGNWRDGILEFEPRGMWKGNGWKTVAKIITQPEMLRAIAQGTPATWKRTSGYSSWFEGTGGWDQLLKEIPDDTDFSPFASKDAFFERTSSLTCSGCHDEGRSVGGFHVLGDGVSSELHGAASAHLLRELPWRQAYVRAVAEGDSPQRQRQPVDGTEPIAAIEAGLSCEDGDICMTQPNAKHLHACRFDKDPYLCARGKATATRTLACESQADCPAEYACATVDEATGCFPIAALAELNATGHEAAVR